MESTRSVGYSFNSAIADIIDNSLAAVPCKNIWIESPPDKLQVSILDDGHGMSGDELREAMRYGVDPNEERKPEDLGRFGLGLKMASLSQCRQLTVISKKDGEVSACRWDLDFVIENDEWILQILDEADYCDSPQIARFHRLSSGTLVVWDRLDKISAKSTDAQQVLYDQLYDASQFIGLTFHRFMDQDAVNQVKIHMNGNRIEPADPFLLHHATDPATFRLPEQRQIVDGHVIRLAGYVLPPTTRLTAEQKKYLGPTNDLQNTQGFYVYRNKRLIIPGTWFRLSRKKELRKNARVQVDIESSSDSLWDIDVRKSSATPPPVFREILGRVMENVSESSENLYRYRGRKENPQGITPVWNRIVDRGNAVRYEVNGLHPQIAAFEDTLTPEQLRDFRSLMKSVGTCVPVAQIYTDMSDKAGGASQAPDEEEEARLLDAGRRLLESGVVTLDVISKTQPWNAFPEVVGKLADEFRREN